MTRFLVLCEFLVPTPSSSPSPSPSQPSPSPCCAVLSGWKEFFWERISQVLGTPTSYTPTFPRFLTVSMPAFCCGATSRPAF
jgi:hypothetical protein